MRVRPFLFFIAFMMISVALFTAPVALLNKKWIFNSTDPKPQQSLNLNSPEKSTPALASHQILAEAHRAGQLDSNPMASEKRLDQLAEKLSNQDLQSMAQIAETPSKNGDLRALAVELLVRNKSQASLSLLEKVIISKWQKSADPQLHFFEQSLRARAIEGLEAHPSELATEILKESLRQTEDSFLNDHGQRALLHRQGQARSVEDQDQDALQKLLRK